MSLQEFVTALDDLADDAKRTFQAATDPDTLEEARVRFLGAKKGLLKDIQKRIGSVGKPDIKTAGMRLNEVKSLIQEAFETTQSRLLGSDDDEVDATFDPTLPGIQPNTGHIHPITQTINHLMEIMGRMGFEAAEGPEVEDPHHNFVALNIPEDHPARDPLDNFYLSVGETQARNTEGSLLLRSQTSTVQIRVMENRQPPIRVISLGRVYRPDAPDATHFPMFHQMEGLMVDKHVTMHTDTNDRVCRTGQRNNPKKKAQSTRGSRGPKGPKNQGEVGRTQTASVRGRARLVHRPVEFSKSPLEKRILPNRLHRVSPWPQADRVSPHARRTRGVVRVVRA